MTRSTRGSRGHICLELIRLLHVGDTDVAPAHGWGRPSRPNSAWEAGVTNTESTPPSARSAHTTVRGSNLCPPCHWCLQGNPDTFSNFPRGRGSELSEGPVGSCQTWKPLPKQTHRHHFLENKHNCTITMDNRNHTTISNHSACFAASAYIFRCTF